MSVSEKNLSRVLLLVFGLTLLSGGLAASIWGVPALLLTGAAGALSVTIIAMWNSLQQMGEPEEMSFEQALSFAAPTATEEQKRALLRTLKDLDYELSVGKISKEDYLEVSAEIRTRAKEMIALSDETMRERLNAAERRWTRHAEMEARRPEAKEGSAKKKGKKAKKPAAAAQEATDESPPREDGDYSEEASSALDSEAIK